MHHSKYSPSTFTTLYSNSPNVLFQVTRKPNEGSWDSPLPSGRIMEYEDCLVCLVTGPSHRGTILRTHFVFLKIPAAPPIYVADKAQPCTVCLLPFAGVQGALLLATALAAGEKPNPNDKPSTVLFPQ